METTVAAEGHGTAYSFVEESLPFEGSSTSEARRRRMEIRRLKTIAHSGGYLAPESKRSRLKHDQSSYTCCSGGGGRGGGRGAVGKLMSSARMPDHDVILRLPMESDMGGEDDDLRRSLKLENEEATARPDGVGALSSMCGGTTGGGSSSPNSSSGEDSQKASSGSDSTSSGTSSMSSDSSSTSHDSNNETEGGSTVSCPADASLSSLPKPSSADASQQQQQQQQKVAGETCQPKESAVAKRDSVERIEQFNLNAPFLPGGCANQCPANGSVSVCGRRREMEDSVASVPAFMSLPCETVACRCGSSGVCPHHFFAVYDGHGGSQAAIYCAERLHLVLAEEMAKVLRGTESVAASENQEEQWRRAISTCFMKMDAEVGGVCWSGGQCGQPEGSPRCCAEPVAPETVGSTAVFAVISPCNLLIANCGDSRAVLSRGGRAIALSVDHKPEKEEEMARIEAAGGRVIFWNGYRVLGVLAMSRAIGDRYLKPYVIAEPDVTCTQRSENDECLILASDGLWDVLSNEVVCDIARKCLSGRRGSAAHGPSAAASSSGRSEREESPAAGAAAVLTKLALARGSNDNISVVVVDLRVRRKH